MHTMSDNHLVPPATAEPTDFASAAAAALSEPYTPASLDWNRPVTFPDVMSQELGQQRRRQHVPISPEQMPRLNELFTEYIGLDPVNLTVGIESIPERDRARRRRMMIATCMQSLSDELEAAGYVPLATPRPGTVAWPYGYEVHTVAATAQLELPAMVATLTSQLRKPEFKALMAGDSNVGWLFDEDDVADLLHLPTSTLRQWRMARAHLEYVKGPGQRGFILYTQRGLEAFIAKHLITNYDAATE